MAALGPKAHDLPSKERLSASSVDDSDVESIGLQIKNEEGHEIKYRTCSWQKVRLSIFSCRPAVAKRTFSTQTAALLFSEYICLAILSFPWSVVPRVFCPHTTYSSRL